MTVAYGVSGMATGVSSITGTTESMNRRMPPGVVGSPTVTNVSRSGAGRSSAGRAISARIA